ncbi:MAG: hypothetical protein KKA42_04465, partial [candidate division Zixibacteria bacterium]|nr:hypothetical protein [candidate division Zixibacteria bacterium]
LDLPEGGDKRQLGSPVGFHFGCFVATNKNELTLFKHTGGSRLVEVELPEPIEKVLGITNVVDSTGKTYLPRHRLHEDPAAGAYAIEERRGRLVLWFDFSSRLELPPDSLTLTYSVTGGTAANGIEIGQITDLYESHPGLSGGANVVRTTGAMPAKTEKQIVDEVSARLRNRDRALSYAEIARWARSFDPRIKRAQCANGVERTPNGVRRCVVIRIDVTESEFYSDDELELMRERLGRFLKSRAPLNTHFKVEIRKT